MLNFAGKILFSLASSLFLATAVFAQGFTEFSGEITSGGINLRTDTTVSSPVVCSLEIGQRVDVVGELYDWYKVRLPKNAPSFVSKPLFECLPDQTGCKSAKALASRINVRLKPSSDSQILGKVDKDQIVNVLGEKNGWLQIEPIHKSFGYVNKKFVIKKPYLVEPGETKPEGKSLPEVKDRQAPPEMLVVSGVVYPHGRIFGRLGTHKLVSGGVTYLLKGNKKSLDAINYKKVKVTGKPFGYQGKYKVIEIVSIESAE